MPTPSMPEQCRAAVTLATWGTLRRGEVLVLNRATWTWRPARKGPAIAP